MRTIDAIKTREVVARAFTEVGLSHDDAQLVARLLVESDLTGHPGHGIYRVSAYVRAVQSGTVDPHGSSHLIAEHSPQTIVVDGGASFGQVAADFTRREVGRRATVHGLCAASLRNCGHVGRLADYVDALADQGLIGLMMVNDAGANLVVVPPRSLEGRLGTNPLAFAVPREQRPHLVMDFATSTVSFGTLVMERRRGAAPSNEPLKKGMVLETFGGYKGFGLSLLVDILAGVLSQAGWSSSRDVPESQGVFMLGVDPEFFCGREYLRIATDEIVQWITSARTDDGVPPSIPGELGEAARRASGNRIDVDDATWTELAAILDDLGIDAESELPRQAPIQRAIAPSGN